MDNKYFDNQKDGLYRDMEKDFQIERKSKPCFMSYAHYHPHYELFYVINGSCRLFVEHQLFYVNSGDMVLLQPSTMHRSQYEDDSPIDRITLSFKKKYLENIKDIIGADFLETDSSAEKMVFKGEAQKNLIHTLEEMLKEDSKKDKYSEINKKSLFLNLLVQIKRNTANATEKENLIDESTASIQKAAKYIFDNYNEDVTLEAASHIAGMRDTYFSRRFQEITGSGFKEYLTNIRIQHSEEMLSTGKLSITQIALACGFTDGNYFGDVFKKKTGLSPRAFRKRFQK
ncbi:MAG: AraC family transcriptional regulator [Treponema sp.]|nr:AraC family transcriptional regulator [Treponema sp.]